MLRGASECKWGITNNITSAIINYGCIMPESEKQMVLNCMNNVGCNTTEIYERKIIFDGEECFEYLKECEPKMIKKETHILGLKSEIIIFVLIFVFLLAVVLSSTCRTVLQSPLLFVKQLIFTLFRSTGDAPGSGGFVLV